MLFRSDVPIEFNMNALKRDMPNESKLREIFEELEFRNLIKRVIDNNTQIKLPGNDDIISASDVQNRIKDDGFHGDLFEVFRTDVKEEIKNSNLRDIKTTQHLYHLIDNESKMIWLAQKFSTCDFFCFDTETTGVNPISAEIVGFSLCAREHEAYYVAMPKTHEEKRKILEIFKPLFENELTLKIGQNIKYDILVLGNYGIEVKGPLFDTMVAHYLIQPELHHGMDYLAEIYLQYNTVKIEELIGEKGKDRKSTRLNSSH